MTIKALLKKDTLYKAVSFLLLAGFLYYWIFTICMVFFEKATRKVLHRQAIVYSSVFNQNWRLFSYPKEYSIYMRLVIRPVHDTAATDTINLVSYSIAEKKKRIPCNSYEEALEKLVHNAAAYLAKGTENAAAGLKKQMPGKDDPFYLSQSSAAIINGSRYRDNLKNLENYGRYVVSQLGMDTSGREYQILISYHYIPPAVPPHSNTITPNEQTIFFSSYKPF